MYAYGDSIKTHDNPQDTECHGEYFGAIYVADQAVDPKKVPSQPDVVLNVTESINYCPWVGAYLS